VRQKRYSQLIGKRVRVRIAKFGQISMEEEGIVEGVSSNDLLIRKDDGTSVLVFKPHHRGDRIEVFENGKWKVWKEIPSKKMEVLSNEG